MPTRRRNHAYTTQQVDYLRQHYADLSPAHFAERWGCSVLQVYDLARRHGIKRRAPNGQPVWRVRRPQLATT